MKFNPQQKSGPKPKKEKKPLKRSPIKKKFKPTGEKHVFEEVLNSVPYTEETKCFVCGERISVVTHCNMAHILRKGSYPHFRLNPNNIRIMCYNIQGTGCHSKFDFSPRSTLTGEGWQKLFDLEAQLKKEYYEQYGKR